MSGTPKKATPKTTKKAKAAAAEEVAPSTTSKAKAKKAATAEAADPWLEDDDDAEFPGFELEAAVEVPTQEPENSGADTPAKKKRKLGPTGGEDPVFDALFPKDPKPSGFHCYFFFEGRQRGMRKSD